MVIARTGQQREAVSDGTVAQPTGLPDISTELPATSAMTHHITVVTMLIIVVVEITVKGKIGQITHGKTIQHMLEELNDLDKICPETEKDTRPHTVMG
ncbi:hypothetical protein MMC06_004127 [Schaereria dolodes]|nr:hypothetical protein [Schaereria dolodes]